MFPSDIKSLDDLEEVFPTEQACLQFLENRIWSGNPISPFDPSSTVYKCSNGRYKCKNTGRYFNIKTGTFLENTKLPLRKWLKAIWLITTFSRGINALQLSVTIGVTHKTAWFMNHRIRACFKVENNPNEKFSGIVEADETFVGGKNKNRHKDKKVPHSQGRAFKDKIPVLGILQRGISNISKVKCIVVPNTKRVSIQPFIKKVVEKDSVLISDEWLGYRGLHRFYDHHIVDHSKKQYVDYDNPEIHSNGIEGFWSNFKRSFVGIYNWWSKKHIQKYVDEFVFRFNLRNLTAGERIIYLILNCRVRTRYKDLVSL